MPALSADQPAVAGCAYEREALLSLDEQAFDQDLSAGGGGWRRIGNVPGCERAAAELIGAYRDRHGNHSGTLLWHEGQLWAQAGEHERAIPLLERSKRKPEDDRIGWNHYVDATVAFLRNDRAGLGRAREALSKVEYVPGPDLPPLKGGYIEVTGQAGQSSFRFRWPPNIEVVDGLLNCFGKPYREAYGASCRAQEEAMEAAG
ncbi:hypothetical protein H0E84_07575 [Luteimonas sp. SJ-92]|uniref:Tetratricopeptide repeat protein n=2 Tax=Luteimonas salinisoli TaxID=2752307 RepID=A0A853JAM2_9GAMM|nr:hypothetical protein [Luteimonas salinisoli]